MLPCRDERFAHRQTASSSETPAMMATQVCPHSFDPRGCWRCVTSVLVVVLVGVVIVVVIWRANMDAIVRREIRMILAVTIAALAAFGTLMDALQHQITPNIFRTNPTSAARPAPYTPAMRHDAQIGNSFGSSSSAQVRFLQRFH